MTLELIPIVVGVAVGLLGFALLIDAGTEDGAVIGGDRRRSPRIERSRKGEAMVGLGVMCMAAAFIGRDTWVYSVVAVIAGTVLLLFGTIANRRYLGEVLSNRGILRRRERY